MTPEQIREMQAGRELDVAIHRQVFGFTDIRRLCARQSQDGCDSIGPASEAYGEDELDWCYLPKYEHGATEDIFCARVPAYSTDIAAAWQVVKKMGERGFYHQLKRPVAGMGNDEYWQALFHDPRNTDLSMIGKAVDKSAARAICRAALLAVYAPYHAGGKEESNG